MINGSNEELGEISGSQDANPRGSEYVEMVVQLECRRPVKIETVGPLAVH